MVSIFFSKKGDERWKGNTDNKSAAVQAIDCVLQWKRQVLEDGLKKPFPWPISGSEVPARYQYIRIVI